MKIGIDCRLWNESGVGRYIRNLVSNLQKLDNKNEYILFVLSKDKSEVLKSIRQAQDGQVQNDNFRIVEADIKWHTIDEQIKFPKILNKENLDLVHFPYFSVPIFYKRPFVVTIHDLILHHFPTGQASTHSPLIYQAKLLAYKYAIKKAAQKARKILTVSNATKQEIIDHLKINSNKIAVTYEGVDKELAVSGQKIAINGKYFLYVGNAYPHKNLERLLEAFRLFCHPELVSGSQLRRDSDFRQNDTRLVLVGREDFFYKRLKEKAKDMGFSKEIIFFGEATNIELANLYTNALALVIPSLMEGFGLPALEAMANKCLVLSSDIPVLKDVCGDVAVYFDPYNAKEITQKMNDVYLNNIYRLSKKREMGLERAKMFSWEKMAKETLKIYNSLAL